MFAETAKFCSNDNSILAELQKVSKRGNLFPRKFSTKIFSHKEKMIVLQLLRKKKNVSTLLCC